MRRSCAIFACLFFSACATAPPPRSTRTYLYQNPIAALDGRRVHVDEAQWHECDIAADRTATDLLEGKSGNSNYTYYDPNLGVGAIAGTLIYGLVAASQYKAFEQERDIDYTQAMKKCLAAKGYAVRPAIVPPTQSFSDTPEQVAAKRAALDKWGPEQYRLLQEEADKHNSPTETQALNSSQPAATIEPASNQPGTGTAVPAAPSVSDVESQLHKLKELHENGLITDDVYKDKMRQILDREMAPPQPVPTPSVPAASPQPVRATVSAPVPSPQPQPPATSPAQPAPTGYWQVVGFTQGVKDRTAISGPHATVEACRWARNLVEKQRSDKVLLCEFVPL